MAATERAILACRTLGPHAVFVTGRVTNGSLVTVTVTPAGSPVANYAFDVTPARLVTGLITERGLCPASTAGLRTLYPDAVAREAVG